MAWITDSLRGAINAVAGLNPFGRGTATALPTVFTHQLAIAAYMSSGLLRKVITIPAADRTQKWRDWQATKETIAAIEKEEKRLGVRAKFRQAEVLRGVGGGAILIITSGDHDKELKPEQIAQGGIVALNVVSRWEIQGLDWVRDLASAEHGQPRMYEVQGDAGQTKIHPSRVICFRGEPIPAGAAISDEDRFWGDCRLLRVFTEVLRSDETKAWFAALVKKAKLLRVGIPNLTDYTATDDGVRKLSSRVALIAEGENTLNATVYDAGNGKDSDSGGEKITDYQVTWNGIPAVMDAFDQSVSAVSDIPFTRLFGRSPAGMNATGEHDTNNWHDAVGDGQENETRPCLEQLDPFLLRSSGAPKADDAWWVWAPLETPTEKQIAETFGLVMDAVAKLIDTGLVPAEALARAVQNLLEERNYLPGLADALKLIPEDIRFGIEPEPDDTDPSELTEGGGPTSERGGATMEATPRRRAANDRRFTDAAPRSLYVQRKLLNAADLIKWANAQGFDTTASADELHVTIAYSRTPVDWMKTGQDWSSDREGKLTVNAGGPRLVEPLGDKGAVVLLFSSSDLKWRHEAMKEAGASFDFDEYQPHVTITYAKPEGLDLARVEPYAGPLVFGPELFSELDEGWRPSEA